MITNSTNTYTGGTTISGGTLSGGGLLGTGNATINAGGTLQVLSGLSLKSTANVVVSTGGTLELFTDLLSTRVKLSGGAIVSHGNRTVSGGTITDAGNASFSTYGETLTLLAPSQTLALTGSRTWTVDAGSTVVMAGNFSGGQDFTKLGAGTLIVQGTSNINNLYVGNGSSAGGYLVGNAALGSSVTIAPEVAVHGPSGQLRVQRGLVPQFAGRAGPLAVVQRHAGLHERRQRPVPGRL